MMDEKDKEKKAVKLKEIHQKMNPFDIKVTKVKHDVGGRKIIGTVGRPAQSKQAGMEQVRKCSRSAQAKVNSFVPLLEEENAFEGIAGERPRGRNCRSSIR